MKFTDMIVCNTNIKKQSDQDLRAYQSTIFSICCNHDLIGHLSRLRTQAWLHMLVHSTLTLAPFYLLLNLLGNDYVAALAIFPASSHYWDVCSKFDFCE